MNMLRPASALLRVGRRLSRTSIQPLKKTANLKCLMQPRYSQFSSMPSLQAIFKREIVDEKGNCFESESMQTLRTKLGKVFEISEQPGSLKVELKGVVDKDHVHIYFNAQDTVESDDDWEDEEEEEFVDVAGEEDEEETDELPAVRFIADISRGKEVLRFDCVASGNVTIEKMRFIKDIDTVDDDEDTYEGPNFVDLEMDMQERLYEYLSDRFVDNDVGRFIAEYADLKEQKEYVSFLENAAKFIK
uniref:Uncharacterized protein AlNc14C36G3168 n=1 Tax=Albugo laibachii Nc14 TaxID=890382 RepID=F0W8P2_9STRA|nr:conserved hypothetical protein [Albugo laibachii Nc14]|eukprot:CCA17499.1 conserved hypothetical protein [Albugo laibachii Nc14]